ncbi:hypothetical protein CEXT_759081 [Caerostris extrusa]|uniref:Uncharacterized protein n=1 Tax=Caerostris extrusa TaxID=172846 RepID=A0AAV4VMV7_CAEEX|nr:hypothetical protein CEXT_759081 [Caerostris extrusa]
MELGGSYYHTIKEVKVSTSNGDFHTSLTVVPRPKNEIAILILKRNNSPAATSQLTSLGIKDWDIFLTENRECGWSA